MNEKELLAAKFEEHRSRLRAVAYRMLGSLSEADDAVQDAWLRLSRTDASAIEDLGRWLTTVVARLCLNQLQSHKARREESLDVHVPDPIVSPADGLGPEQELLLADAVGLALGVVLETLGPAERLAFVMHDMFGLAFEEIAPIVGRTPAAARQLASRARRRVQGATPTPELDLERQRTVVSAYYAAARAGDLQGLLEVLDPEVVLRVDYGSLPGVGSREVRGARAVAGGAVAYSRQERVTLPALVNGTPGFVSFEGGKPVAVAGFTVAGGRIVGIEILADPERLARLGLDAIASATERPH